ncbi:hypothetical protein F5887DRAFT_114594 [Amanita rubescens]|nr:hypothetical protein F5887DRAFT_114594 [Amanita rubescens]
MLFFYALLFFLLPAFVVAAPGRSGLASGNPVEKGESVEKKGESVAKGEPLSNRVTYLLGGPWIRDGWSDYLENQQTTSLTFEIGASNLLYARATNGAGHTTDRLSVYTATTDDFIGHELIGTWRRGQGSKAKVIRIYHTDGQFCMEKMPGHAKHAAGKMKSKASSG